MKYFLLFIGVLCSVGSNAQTKTPPRQLPNQCGVTGEPDNIHSMRRTASPHLRQQIQENMQSPEKKKKPSGTTDEYVLPVVFHILLTAEEQSIYTDRVIYDQIEVLNEGFNGKKAAEYSKVIPEEVRNLIGKVRFHFTLAHAAPDGSLTTGIERKVITAPFDQFTDATTTATGGLDEWDADHYINIWISHLYDQVNGVAVLPPNQFITGARGVMIIPESLPVTSPVQLNSYLTTFGEGHVLVHEMGHYFYLWHTFGWNRNDTTCNNSDFALYADWPLPEGDGYEGDDTPPEKFDLTNFTHMGNPSMNYAQDCPDEPEYGIVYGSFMNYYDSRASFMFTKGYQRRMEDCLNIYFPDLIDSKALKPPVQVNDINIATLIPRGLPERRNFQVNHTPLEAVIRNEGTQTVFLVRIEVRRDNVPVSVNLYPLLLSPGKETTIRLGDISGIAGDHVYQVISSFPNLKKDMFTANDTITAYYSIQADAIRAPFSEDFSGTAFPPAGWKTFNPNPDWTFGWAKTTTDGFNKAGAAYKDNWYQWEGGTLDDLVTPAIDFGNSDSASLRFHYAYGVYSNLMTMVWDGLEIYISGDGGRSNTMIYKKTGPMLATVPDAFIDSFTAFPNEKNKWKEEIINLAPYIIPGKPMIIKFRNTSAWGNNLYIDDVAVTAGKFSFNISPTDVKNLPSLIASQNGAIKPELEVSNPGGSNVHAFKVTYAIDNQLPKTIEWGGNLRPGGTARVAIPSIQNIISGKHQFTAYTSWPEGVADEVPVNDTIQKAFAMISLGKVGKDENAVTINPNPTRGLIHIRHEQSPVNLRSVEVYTVLNQLIYKSVYNGNAGNDLTINLAGLQPGIYLVKLIYENDCITQRVILAN